MKELIDKLWAGIASAGGRVVLPSNGEVILPSSKNLIMDAGEGNITLKLPETTGVTEPFVCEFTVDHDFDLIENKDLTKKVFLQSTDGTPVHCRGGFGNLARLPMISNYKAFFVPKVGWRIPDAILEKISLSGYEIKWLGGCDPVITDDNSNLSYRYRPETLVLMDGIITNYNANARRTFLSIDGYTNYSIEDPGQVGKPTQYQTGLTIDYEGVNWELTNVLPFYWPYGAPSIDLLAHGSDGRTAMFRFYNTNVNAFGVPTFMGEQVPYHTVHYDFMTDDGENYSCWMCKKTQIPRNWEILYRDSSVFDSNGLCWTKAFTFTNTTYGSGDVKDFAIDRKLAGCFIALVGDFDYALHFTYGFTRETTVRNTANGAYTGTVVRPAGWSAESLIEVPAPAPGYRWKIVGWDAYEGYLWLEQRPDYSNMELVDTASGGLYRFWVYGGASNDVIEVVTSSNGSTNFDHERFVEPLSSNSFWLSRGVEPQTGRTMLYVQEDFPAAGDVWWNNPVLLFDPNHYDFDLACYTFMPKLSTDVGFLGMKAKDGHWRVAEVNPMSALALPENT